MALPTVLPEPQLPNPFEVPSLGWGVIGPGRIAHQFVSSTIEFTGQRFTAVASTDIERAQAFAEQYGIASAYGNYEDLFADPAVDVVYIATRQNRHLEPVLAAIAAGKHVLVEKPLALLPADARIIRDAAAASDVFVMEAMWTTYLPQSYLIRQLIAEDVLGPIRFVQADLGQDLRGNDRMFDPHGGGGTSHDMGIYPVAFASQFFDTAPTGIAAIGSLTDDGVEDEIVMRLSYPGDASAIALASARSYSLTTGWVDGERASLRLDGPFFVPTTVTLLEHDFNPRTLARWTDTTPIQAHLGLSYQATALAGFVADGLRQSPFRSLDVSVRDLETITTARHQIGAIYPGE